MKKGPYTYLFAFLLTALVVLPGIGWGQTPIVAEWNFENSNKRAVITNNETFISNPYTADEGSFENKNIQIINLAGGATFSAWVLGSEGTGSFAPNAVNWDNGVGKNFWQVKISTKNFENITVSSKQLGSNTGPRDFKLEYSLNGSIWSDVTGSSITVANNFTSGVLSLLPLPETCNDQDELYLRWIMTSNINVEGGIVGSSGTNRIDQIIINGFRICGKEETFFFSNASGNYTEGNFTGNDGVQWYYYHSRDEGSYPIDEKGIMFQNASQSRLETGTIKRGIGSFSMQMRKAFTNTNPRQLELYVNGVKAGESDVFGTNPEEDNKIHAFEVNEINIPGDFSLMIKNVGSTSTERQAVIDNISWTCYIEPICPTTFHYYRSKQSGHWEDASTWQASEDENSWNNAQCVPDYRAKGIIIRNGHAVIINEFLRINQTIIESGGTIIRGRGNKRLIINDGPSDDLVVYGVFRHAASLPAPDYQGTIKVKPEGMIEVTNNLTSASHYGVSNKIFYENGSVFYWNVGSSAPFLTSNQTYFPNSGPEKIPIFRLSTPNISVGANSQTIINGIFEVTQNNVNFQNTGDKIFRNGISGPGKVTQASNSGAFIINGTEAKLNIENLDLKGNMNISPTTNILSGSTNLSLTGTNSQTLTLPPPNPDPVRFARITVNNSTGVSIDQDIQVKNTLSMQAGNIYNEGKTITVGESLTQTGHIIHENGFIHGKLRRWIPFSTTDNIIFPIGKPGLDTPTSVRYTTAPAGGTLAVEFIEEDMGIPPEPVIVIPHTDDCPEFGVEYLSYQGFWRFEPDGLSGGTYDITFNPRGLEIITDICQLTALKRNSGEWQSEGTHVEPEGAIASPIIKRTGVTSGFSDWGIGGGIDNPLPIELLSFTAEYKTGKVLLNWATGSEINNDFFTLERSRDAVNTEIIGFVEGAGNSSNTLHYQFVDRDPLPGISYYRLKQTDFDGSFEYSQWVAVEASDIDGRLQAQAISQPQGLLLRIYTSTERPLQILLTDIYGRIVYSEQLSPGSPGQIETFVPMPQAASSVLLYRITDGLDVVTGKVVR